MNSSIKLFELNKKLDLDTLKIACCGYYQYIKLLRESKEKLLILEDNLDYDRVYLLIN